MRYYLLACTLPGNIEKEIIAIKRTLFSRSASPSAMVLPLLVPVQWSRELWKPEDVALGPRIPGQKDIPGAEGSERGDPGFTASPPRLAYDLWWLPVLPPPKVTYKGVILRPYPGVPLVAASSESSTPALAQSSTVLSPEASVLQKTLQTIPTLSWKAMGLSCFVFSSAVFHSSGKPGDREEPFNERISENEGPWDTNVFRERGMEWEEAWRAKKPVLPEQ